MKRLTVLCIVGVWFAAAYGADVQEVVQYQTDFERSPLADGWNVRQGTWTHDAVAGTYTSPGSGGQLCTYEGPLAYGGNSLELKDYAISAELESQGANFAGLAGRVNGNGSLYNLRYNATAGTERLELYRIGGPTLLLASAPLALADLPAKYTLSLKMAGTSLEGKLFGNDVELAVVTAEDGVYSSGPGGLRNSFSGGEAVYHSVTLTEPLYTMSRNVSPPDGSGIEETWAELKWLPGAFSLSSSVYMGTDFDDVNEGAAETFLVNTVDVSLFVGLPDFPFPEGLVPGTTYYWRVDEVNESDPNSPWKGDVWSFFVYPNTAYNPIPADGMKFVDPNADLSWDAYKDIDSFSVYFGTDPDRVAQGLDSPVIVDANDASFDPGPLEFDSMYYWRVDVVRQTGETATGGVWSFTTARQGGGLIGNYYAWKDGLIPTPVESAFSGKLCMTRIDPTINFFWGEDSPDASLVPADYFAVAWDGELDVPFTDTYTFYAAADDGVILQVNNQEVIHNWLDGWGHEQRGKIDLVGGEKVPIQMWFYTTDGLATARLLWESDIINKQVVPSAAYYLPKQANSPNPPNGAVDVAQRTKLQWYVGRMAVEHDVYFGEDANAVANADTSSSGIYIGRQELDTVVFDPGPLEWDKTYYWRIDEINSDNPESPWKGDVWSFTTANFLTVDDFESYTNDDPNGEAIWQTWIDGYGVTDNGAQVGNLMPPYCEQTIVHSGAQSMPLFYVNEDGVTNSEAVLSLTALRDWTQAAVTELSLWFRGLEDNAAEPLYVAISNTASTPVVVAHDDPGAVSTTTWTQWVIPLQSLANQGIDLTNVDKLAIGLGSQSGKVAAGGTGTLYVDDIRLYQP